MKSGGWNSHSERGTFGKGGTAFSMIMGIVVGFSVMFVLDRYFMGLIDKFETHYRHVNFLKQQACSTKARMFASHLDNLGGESGIGKRFINEELFWYAWRRIVFLNEGRVAPLCDKDTVSPMPQDKRDGLVERKPPSD